MILGRLIGVVVFGIFLGVLNFLNIKYQNINWFSMEALFIYITAWGIFISWGQIRLFQSMLNTEDELKNNNKLIKGINNVLSRRRPSKEASRKEVK